MKRRLKKLSGNPIKYILILTCLTVSAGFSQTIAPDSRFKADILLVLAHPDDETAIGSQLAKWVFDDGKKIAAVYTNRGQGGGNTYGREQYHAMGAIREVEVRQALSAFDISNVWFLDGVDTPGQDVLHSLQNLPHGASLEKLVRYVRLTQPDIIITWLPHFSAGENHGDHQAAGVLATEAFDLAGNPAIFPAQLGYPREIQDINNFYEGLLPWQVKKLYFFSDRDEPLKAPGPAFDVTTVSQTKGKPFIELAAQLNIFHKTQGFVADMTEEALKTGQWQPMISWLEKFQLIFGKAVVKCRPDGDVFEGIGRNTVRNDSFSGTPINDQDGIRIELGGVFDYYRHFWQAHNLGHLSELLEPEISISYGSYFHVPLLLINNEKKSFTLKLNADLPEGWEALTANGEFTVDAGQTLPVQTFYFAPSEEGEKIHTLTWKIIQGKKIVDNVHMNVILSDWTLPQ